MAQSVWRLATAGRSGDQVPGEVRFSALVQTSPEAHPSLLYNGQWVSFPGVKWRGRGDDHPPPSSTEVKERLELEPYSPSQPPWPLLG
jgi:hypothetical protein